MSINVLSFKILSGRYFMKTRIIPSKVQEHKKRIHPENDKIRVAAYCRVSTDSEEQENSFEIQRTHYSKMIEDHAGWELAGIYADEGISGVSTKHRDQFKAMIRDCEAGRIDLILTKSLSRFARNTLDALTYIRKLRGLGIAVVFEKESINTLDAQGELLITILSSLAQQESESISRNVRMGIRFRFQEGKVCAGHQNMLGYTRTKEGGLTINDKEAEVVRRIYRMYLDGYTPGHIGEILRAYHVTDRSGRERTWNLSTINYILRNEKYMGDLLLQKYYTEDFLTKKVVVNRGQISRYYVEDAHPPIIPKAVYRRVQNEIARRKEQRIRYKHKSPLAGLVCCALCGSPYIRRRERGGNVYLRCGSKTHPQYRDIKRHPNEEMSRPQPYSISDQSMHQPCPNESIEESHLESIILTAIKKAGSKKDTLIHLKNQILTGPVSQADRILHDIKDEYYESSKYVRIEGSDRKEWEDRIHAVTIRKAEYM
ncbi:MAG: recombinase family protein, partial [Eubacterium sp.]|nr:recombinase family protein [Eubacterium sp.]